MLEQIWRNMPPVVKNLLLINLLMFVGTILTENAEFSFMENFSVFYFDSPFFKPMQIVTHMFMHGSIGHIFFNMFALVSFGTVLEKVWGPKRFLLFYFITGLGAVALHQMVMMYEVYDLTGQIQAYHDGAIPNIARLGQIYQTPTVGASGAIFGLLVAFGMLFPNTELMMLFIPVPVKAKYFIPFLILLELFLGVQNFQWDNIAHFAHLGGALLGFIMVKLWNKNRNKFF